MYPLAPQKHAEITEEKVTLILLHECCLSVAFLIHKFVERTTMATGNTTDKLETTKYCHPRPFHCAINKLTGTKYFRKKLEHIAGSQRTYSNIGCRRRPRPRHSDINIIQQKTSSYRKIPLFRRVGPCPL